MAFNRSIVSNASLLKGLSDKILGSFTKTKTDLEKLNTKLESAISENDEQIKTLNEENSQMTLLKKQHDNVIENINKFLGNL